MVSAINLKLPLSQLFEVYKKWITKNPNLISDIESIIKYASFFAAGRLTSSALASEFVYSLPNLMVLFNDEIMKASRNYESKLPTLHSKLKIWLTIIDYTEALFEVSAKRVWGEAGRWFIISLIQLLKVVMRLILVFRYKECITHTPAIPPLNRERFNENNDGFQFPKKAFSLKRSGKVVRTVRSCSAETRMWMPIESSSSPDTELGNATLVNSLRKSLLVAETMYILKPLLHLGCLSVSGPRNWNPWLLSFLIDLVSLKCLSKKPTFTREEREEIIRRRIGLLFYILRSPFYDNCSRMKIFTMLETISKTVPLARLIAEPIAKYLPYWQSTYFYMWSS